MDDDVTVFGFNESDCNALIKMIGTKPPIGPHPPVDDSTALFFAYTTSGAPGRSGTALGRGTAVIQYIVPSTGDDYEIESGSDEVTFYNVSTTAVGGTKYLMLLRHGAILLANWEEC